MSQPLPSPLPLLDRNLLGLVKRIVPCDEREEWFRTWQAELWHMHHRSRNHPGKTLSVATDLSIGLTRDALWLRTDSWRRSFTGTPTLCLATLLGLCLVSTLVSLALSGSWHALSLYLGGFARPGGRRRRVAPGAAADLCLLAVPLAEALHALDAGLVAATLVAGRLVFDRRAGSAARAA